MHVGYCHAPFRYAWYEEARALHETRAPLRPLLRLQLRRMRRWDLGASRRVDTYLANSALTQERIKRYYGRESTVIHPPVEAPLQVRRTRRRPTGGLRDRAPQAPARGAGGGTPRRRRSGSSARAPTKPR